MPSCDLLTPPFSHYQPKNLIQDLISGYLQILTFPTSQALFLASWSSISPSSHLWQSLQLQVRLPCETPYPSPAHRVHLAPGVFWIAHANGLSKALYLSPTKPSRLFPQTSHPHSLLPHSSLTFPFPAPDIGSSTQPAISSSSSDYASIQQHVDQHSHLQGGSAAQKNARGER